MRDRASLAWRGLCRLRRPAVAAGAALLSAALLLYALTLDDGLRPGELQGGDLITHHYAQTQGRPSNAPGYPLYTMGGWLWFRLGRLLTGRSTSPIPLLSSYSTFWALVSLALLYALARELISGTSEEPPQASIPRWLVPALCTAFYSVTYFFWYYAVTSEQYTSAVAQTLAMFLLALRWNRAQDDRGGGDSASKTTLGAKREAGDYYLLLLSVLVGVGLAHMVTVLLVVPPLLWFVLSRRPDLLQRRRFLAACVGLALLPLLSYGFVYVRGMQHPEWRGSGEWASTWEWFWQFVSTQQGRGELTWSLQPLSTPEFPSLIWRELTWVVLLGGLVGIGLLGRRRALLFFAALVFYFAFCWVDRLGNWYQVIMPAYPLLVLGFAQLLSRVWWSSERLARPPGGGRHRGWTSVALRVVLLVGLTALIAYRSIVSYPKADSSRRAEDTGLDPAWAILADDPQSGAAVLGDHEQNEALRYVTNVWGLRPDLRPVGTDEAGRLLLEGQTTVYATVEAGPLVWSEVSTDARLSSAGLTLVELAVRPAQRVVQPQQSLLLNVGDNLRLLGYDRQAERGVVTLYWQAVGPIGHDWSVSIRPTQGGEFIFVEGQLLQFDQRHPVHGLYPMTGWDAGEVVRDDYPLVVPPGISTDGALVVIYRPEGGDFEHLNEVRLHWG